MEQSYFDPIFMFTILWQMVIPLATFIASAYYLSKKSCTESVLLAGGSFLSLVTVFLFNYFARNSGTEFYSGSVFPIVQGLSYVGSLLFTIGFIMLVVKTIKREEDF